MNEVKIAEQRMCFAPESKRARVATLDSNLPHQWQLWPQMKFD